MDILLTRSALQSIEAAAPIGRRTVSGSLLGHKRGGRVIVERAVASGFRVFPGREEYARAVSILGCEIVGFYSFVPPAAIRKTKPPPFSVGKVVLSVGSGKNGCRLRAWSVDYTDRFVWKPLRITSPGGRRHA
ncbi:MAG: hypothetical protein JW747_01055 [Candidatus Aminicenantes bacterium]|nr:hypothetical protein [Candidatus Aminicenantes bacterium]